MAGHYREQYIRFRYDGYSFGKGEITLNGEEALAYTRMRKEDRNFDFGRQNRQHQVIEGIINKGSPHEIRRYVQSVENNVKTNLTFNYQWDIQSGFKEARSKVIQHELKCDGTK